jgi:hypothetical protein
MVKKSASTPCQLVDQFCSAWITCVLPRTMPLT